MAGLTKIEGGVAYPARFFLDRPEQNKPSTWALRVYELIDGEPRITKTQLGRAAAALGSKGFMGNRHIAHSVGKSYKQLKKALLSKYREIGVPDDSIPSYLLSAPNVARSRSQNGRKSTDTNKFISHYGTKGMKWGIRKDRKTGGQRLSAKAKKMTSDDLKTTIKRMQLERQYSDLVSKESKANQTRLSSGKARVEKAVVDAGQEQLKNVISSSIGLGVKIGAHQISQTPAGQTLLAFSGKKDD